VFDGSALAPLQRRGPRRGVVLALCGLLGATLGGAVGWAMKGGTDQFLGQQASRAPVAKGSAKAADATGDKLPALALAGSASAPAAAASAAASASAPAASASIPAAAASAAPPGSPATAATADSLAALQPLFFTEHEAWRALATAWDVNLGDGDPCQAAQRQQLQCYHRGNASLASIRLLGRPGILTIYEQRDKPSYALLTGLTRQGAILRTGGESREVPLSTLAQVWRGDFATFWRAPPGYSGLLYEGHAGSAVDGLASQLAKLRGEPAPRSGRSFDADLKAQVHAFQLAQGLSPDGIAGPTTFMQLNRATGVSEPRLETGS
jgi:general secretion pathway protein A